MKNLTIAIDGPAASGKSTTAKLLARKLGLTPIDTGAMYRAVTLKVLRLGISPEDEAKVVEIAKNTDIWQECNDGVLKTYMDGEDVSEEIRTPEVSKYVSVVAKYPGVRKHLVEIQRKLAKQGGVVVEGRDIGTYVLPDADIKVFMKASLEERVRRRLAELKAKGVKVSAEEIRKELETRDRIDSSRAFAPLKPAEDAFVLDTTNLTIEQQVEKIIEKVHEKFGDEDP